MKFFGTTTIVLFLSMMFCSTCSFAQTQEDTEATKVSITKKNGDRISGTLVNQSEGKIIISTFYGEVVVSTDDIVEIEYDTAGTIKLSEYSASQYLVIQSAFGLKKGQAYYKNTLLFFNSFSWGVNDNFTLTAGTELVSLLTEGVFPSLYVVPKLHFPFRKGSVSAGSSIVRYHTANDVAYVTLLQGNVSIGDLDSNLTLGAGYGYRFDAGDRQNAIQLGLSGIAKLSDKTSLISENWLLSGDFDTIGIFSLGVRFHSRTRNNFLTVAFVRPTGDFISSFVWPFLSGTVVIN